MGDDQQFPRLAISDLIVLTLSLAFATAYATPGIQHILNQTYTLSNLDRWRATSREVADSTAFGLSLFGLLVLARQRIRGAKWQLAPGHWLLIAAGPFSICVFFVIAYQRIGPR